MFFADYLFRLDLVQNFSLNFGTIDILDFVILCFCQSTGVPHAFLECLAVPWLLDSTRGIRFH